MLSEFANVHSIYLKISKFYLLCFNKSAAKLAMTIERSDLDTPTLSQLVTIDRDRHFSISSALT